ncbi:MAG: hypothetical protein FWE08_06450 [Oscillospiraceae bacterium]|nr:hypothetical protein [Oscillospiraceae bacterium]
MKTITPRAPVILALILLTFSAIFILVRSLGYAFVPHTAAAVVFIAFTVAATILLTVLGVKHRNEQTKVSGVCAALLPLLAIVYITAMAAAINMIHTPIHNILTILTFLCSVILFFACTRGLIVKILPGIIYAYFMWIFLYLQFGPLYPAPLRFTETGLSPNAAYAVEVRVTEREHLSFASADITITPQNRTVNLGIGELWERHMVSYHRQTNINTITLRWESDEILYIYIDNDNTLRFHRDGRRWVDQWGRQ